MRAPVSLPQSLADRHTLLAQSYAGFFLGHPYRAVQQRTGPDAIQVNRDRPWREPAVLSDDCDFCRRLTDAEAARRVAGYQHAIDIEVLRARADLYTAWLNSGSPEIPEIEEVTVAGVVRRRGITISGANRRRFIELYADKFEVGALSLVELPLRLKRKLCIEWNHLYRDWLLENPDTQYDFSEREFFREVGAAAPPPPERDKSWWQAANPFSGGTR